MKGIFSMVPPKSEGEPADLYLYGDIEEGAWCWYGDATPLTVLDAIKRCESDALNVHINSYGGYTSAGIAIYNTLRESKKKVTTIVEGFACSSASLIFCAGDERIMRDSALLMIHNAWTAASGNADQLRKTADDLETISAATAKIYEANSNLSAEAIKELMDAETWIDAETAKSYGMVTAIEQDDEPEENGVMSCYSSAFGAIKQRLTAPEAVLEKGTLEIDPEAWADLLGKLTDAVKETLTAGIRQTAMEQLNPKPEPNPTTEATAFEKLFRNFH